MKHDIAPPQVIARCENIKTHVERIRGLVADLRSAIEAIAAEFKEVATIKGGSGPAIDVLHAEMPAVGLEFWRNISLVAERRLHPLALSSGCPIKPISRLSYQEQEKALTEGVPVALTNGDHRLVPAHLLTGFEIAKAIDNRGHLRSVSEQIAYDREKAAEYEARKKEYLASIREVVAEEPDDTSKTVTWRVIRKGRAQILRVPLTVTEKDVMALLKDMRRGT
jgi:hypothetical protein